MSDIKVSIVVPMYNKEKRISRCLDSLVNQTLQEIEIIVVDDGSSDNSADIVRGYQENDSRVRLITQENQGPGTARNTGIADSRGKYVGFVDCDDYVELTMYETMFNAAETTDSEVAVCQERNVCVDAEGKSINLGETQFPYEQITKVNGKTVIEWFLNFTHLSLNSMCFKIIRKSVFDENHIWFPDDFRYAEDLNVSGCILSVVESVAIIPESLYIYVHELNTFSTNYTLKKAWDVYKDLEEVLGYLKKVGYTGTVNNFILGMSFSSMRQLYASKEKKDIQYQKEKKELLNQWKTKKKGIHPVLNGMDMPIAHKIKVLVSWMRLEKLVCCMINVFSGIPFFKFMV